MQLPTRSVQQRQEHGGDKYRNWSLTPERPILFLGDSNLSHIPPLDNGNLQIVSYPGAKFEHAYHIIKNKTPTSPQVQQVVLAFGLNNRERLNRAHFEKTIQRMLGAAYRTFPNAVIHIPLINFNKFLPTRHTDNLIFLNDIIQRTSHSIPLLPWESFRTQEDKVHWTLTTGKTMMSHWLKHLN